nr:MAG TPA: hypothetical protein [Caudoviricetes sp.]
MIERYRTDNRICLKPLDRRLFEMLDSGRQHRPTCAP